MSAVLLAKPYRVTSHTQSRTYSPLHQRAVSNFSRNQHLQQPRVKSVTNFIQASPLVLASLPHITRLSGASSTLQPRAKRIHTSLVVKVEQQQPQQEQVKVQHQVDNKPQEQEMKNKQENKDLERFSAGWWWDKFIVCLVFAITGSSTMYVVRPLMGDLLHLQGSLREGPWSFRLSYFAIMMPVYSSLLFCVGTIFGRKEYFKRFVIKMWSRFLPSSVRQKLFGNKPEAIKDASSLENSKKQ